MSALGMRMVSGMTVGVVGGLIGIHYSLAFSALALAAVVLVLLLRSTARASNVGSSPKGQS